MDILDKDIEESIIVNVKDGSRPSGSLVNNTSLLSYCSMKIN